MALNLFINDQEKGKNNEMWNLYSAENHLAQRGPKEERKGSCCSSERWDVMHRKSGAIYTERGDVKSSHMRMSVRTKMVSRRPKHPCEESMHHSFSVENSN